MDVSSVGAEDKAAEASTGSKRHSPVFLAVFAVFLIATAICMAGTVIGVAAAQPSHHDTQWFWASGHLLVHGESPYDRQAIREMETVLGLRVGSDLPMTRNPPSSLFLMAPLGLLGPRAGMLAWVLMLALCLAISIWGLRSSLKKHYQRGLLWLAWCFAPALLCLEMGQTGLIILVGLALFLWFHESRPLWAGAALSLCAMKPHLLLPFEVALLAWIVARRKWSIFVGTVAALAIESLIAMAFDPHVWGHYFAAMRVQKISEEFVPTLGVALRFAVDRTAMWVEFVPAALGCAWGLWYFLRNQERWDWQTHGALLTLISLTVAPYSWFTDQVIALPAILFALMGARKPRRGSLTLLLAVMSGAALEMILVPGLYSKIYIAQAIAWLAWYLYARSGRAAGPEPATSAGLANA
jgi:hypothetical protein